MHKNTMLTGMVPHSAITNLFIYLLLLLLLFLLLLLLLSPDASLSFGIFRMSPLSKVF